METCRRGKSPNEARHRQTSTRFLVTGPSPLEAAHPLDLSFPLQEPRQHQVRAEDHGD